MYFKETKLIVNIKNALGWSAQTQKDLKKITQAEITKFCKERKLKRKDIVFNIIYQAEITIKVKQFEDDKQVNWIKEVNNA